MLRSKIALLVGSLALPLVFCTTTDAGPCDSLQQLANQTAGYYRSSNDPGHRASAQNYQNAYNACLNSARAQQQTIRPGRNPGAMFNALSGILGVLGSMNTGGGDSLARLRAEEAARAEADRLEREARAQAEQLERQQAEQARVQAEEAERARIAAADQRARCLARNPFGTSSGCEGATGSRTASPFRTCPRPLSSGCDWGDTPPSKSSPFAKRPDDRLASATTGASSAQQASPTPSGASDNQFDSVLKVKCPGGIQPGCIGDDWRRGFALLAKHGKAVPRYKPPDYSKLVISTEQYERLGRGETTFEEAERANYVNWINSYTKTLSTDLETRLAEIPDDPQARLVIERLKRSGQPMAAYPKDGGTSVPWSDAPGSSTANVGPHATAVKRAPVSDADFDRIKSEAVTTLYAFSSLEATGRVPLGRSIMIHQRIMAQLEQQRRAGILNVSSALAQLRRLAAMADHQRQVNSNTDAPQADRVVTEPKTGAQAPGSASLWFCGGRGFPDDATGRAAYEACAATHTDLTTSDPKIRAAFDDLAEKVVNPSDMNLGDEFKPIDHDELMRRMNVYSEPAPTK